MEKEMQRERERERESRCGDGCKESPLSVTVHYWVRRKEDGSAKLESIDASLDTHRLETSHTVDNLPQHADCASLGHSVVALLRASQQNVDDVAVVAQACLVVRVVNEIDERTSRHCLRVSRACHHTRIRSQFRVNSIF